MFKKFFKSDKRSSKAVGSSSNVPINTELFEIPKEKLRNKVIDELNNPDFDFARCIVLLDKWLVDYVFSKKNIMLTFYYRFKAWENVFYKDEDEKMKREANTKCLDFIQGAIDFCEMEEEDGSFWMYELLMAKAERLYWQGNRKEAFLVAKESLPYAYDSNEKDRVQKFLRGRSAHKQEPVIRIGEYGTIGEHILQMENADEPCNREEQPDACGFEEIYIQETGVPTSEKEQNPHSEKTTEYDIDNSRIGNEKLTIEEEKYKEEILFCLEEGGIITDDDRKYLERKRKKFGISEERAREIEQEATPSLTENEKEYLETFKELAASGTLTDRAKRLLERERESLGIPKERATEIENLVSNE